VLHPDLRGKGFGKYLMLISEKFAREKGFKEAYLCTIDRQIFYSRCGYSFCDPVCAYSGNIKLPSGLTSTKTTMGAEQTQNQHSTSNSDHSNFRTLKASQENPEKSNSYAKKNGAQSHQCGIYKIKNSEGIDIQSTSSDAPTVDTTILDNCDATDLSVLCAKLYCRPSLSSIPPDPLKCPLRSLAKNNNDKIKISKSEICRATIPKDYMKKKL